MQVNPGEGFNLSRDVYVRVVALMDKLRTETKDDWTLVCETAVDCAVAFILRVTPLSTNITRIAPSGLAAVEQSSLETGEECALGQVFRPQCHQSSRESH